MLKHFQLGSWTMLVSFPPTLPCSPKVIITSFESENRCSSTCCTFKASNNVVFKPLVYLSMRCAARRRVRYDDDDNEDGDSKEHNKEIAILALLEMYSQSVRGEALIVHAMVDDQPIEVLIFKGFSSCLSYKTTPGPSGSILPARAVIERIDRVKGPFDPSNIEYLQRDLSWEVFKSNLPPNLITDVHIAKELLNLLYQPFRNMKVQDWYAVNLTGLRFLMKINEDEILVLSIRLTVIKLVGNLFWTHLDDD